MKKTLVLIVAAILMLSLFGCSDKKNADVSGVVDAPDKFSTLDEAKVTENPNIRKESENVNGMCYAITLEEFTYNYNEMLKEAGNLDMINPKGWKMLGSPQNDANGTEYQYYYYNADKINFTASVETKTNYIMNIGLGTTMSNFVSIENEKNNSDTILMKSAVIRLIQFRIFSILQPLKIQMSCGTTAMSMLSAPMRIRQTVNAVQCCFAPFLSLMK